MRKGYVLLFTGDGKGKTTSALGIAFRAAGWGMKTYIAQFMKGCETGELKAAERFRDLIKIELFGSKRLVSPQRLVEEDKKLAQNGLLRAREAMFSGHYDIVILDEINVAVKYGLVKLEKVLDFIREKPKSVDLILTGRYAPQELIEAADLVSEIREVKHYYKKGINARRGIEF